MATFTGPKTQLNSEYQWAAKQLGKVQRADKEHKMVIDRRMAMDAQTPTKKIQRHGEEDK